MKISSAHESNGSIRQYRPVVSLREWIHVRDYSNVAAGRAVDIEIYLGRLEPGNGVEFARRQVETNQGRRIWWIRDLRKSICRRRPRTVELEAWRGSINEPSLGVEAWITKWSAHQKADIVGAWRGHHSRDLPRRINQQHRQRRRIY